MPTADTRHSIVIVKQGTYRGATKRYTNRYHFEGDVPSDTAAWTAFADAIVLAEKAIHNIDTTIVEAIGYDAGSASTSNPHGDSVFAKTYTTAGTRARTSGDSDMPGDAAYIVRYSTEARSTRNHPIYLMNYYHGGEIKATDPDLVSDACVAAAEDYADAWLTGFVADGTHRERCGPRGAVAVSRRVDPFTRHRDFPS